jgi:4a-hydroxytetrahydrobiopterin dehydratase
VTEVLSCQRIGKEVTLQVMKIEELRPFLQSVPKWKEEGKGISRDFLFKNFVQALEFVNRVGELAEKEGHHPDILIYDYKKVKLSLWTHTQAGLTENDFKLATKIDSIALPS